MTHVGPTESLTAMEVAGRIYEGKRTVSQRELEVLPTKVLTTLSETEGQVPMPGKTWESCRHGLRFFRKWQVGDKTVCPHCGT